MMIDHMSVTVSDIASSRAFYEAALAPLGIALVMEIGPEMTGGTGTALGYGRDGHPFFWLGDFANAATKGVHVALSAQTRASVDAFHAAALAAGGTDNGAPGLRKEYSPNYYAAFVLDPDGINIEAVCHTPE